MTTEAVEDAEPMGRQAPNGEGDRQVEAVIESIDEAARRVKRREVDEAVRTLDADGDLTDGQRDVVEALADAIVDRLLAVPTRGLREGGTDGRVSVETVRSLFEPAFGADVGPERADASGRLEVHDGD